MDDLLKGYKPGRCFDFPGFVPAYIRPLFCEGKGPFRWAALSGDPNDIAVTDASIWNCSREPGYVALDENGQRKDRLQGITRGSAG